MEDRIFKIIVVTCLVIMVSIVGVTASLILNDKLKTPTTASIPPTNQTVDNTSSQQANHTNNGQSSHPPYISSQQAINIAKKAGDGENVRFTAKLITSTSRPYYLITVYGTDPSKPGYNQGVGGAKVDAVTGEIIDAMG